MEKADRQRQRQEHRLGRAHHEERRHEHRQDAEHRQQPRPGGFGGGVQRRAAQRACRAARCDVDVLDRDRGLVHQNAHRQARPPRS